MSIQPTDQPTEVLPGVWRLTLGEPEEITPVRTRHYQPAAEALEALPHVDGCPILASGDATSRGYLVRLPLAAGEVVYGLGLQLQSFIQRGRKKMLRVNADPEMDSGDSHAPVPFYVTTKGYGVLVDTARYATFYCGNNKRRPEALPVKVEQDASGANAGANALPAAYARYGGGTPSEMLIEVPRAAGADVYIFAGPSLRQAVQRYNLFAGGGALPPRWGLGFWYRCKTDFKQADILTMASELRQRNIPCDVLGLEPRWQSQAYSCSFTWNEGIHNPPAMVTELAQEHYRVNLWEHAFTHPSSPIYETLLPHSGDYEVWGGLVPDFLTPEARRIFADLHDKEHVALGISGYKLDECDNSDFTGGWSFPEISRFPSGADGEQMHSLLGLRYQDALQSVFEKRKERTFGLVRSSQALAAPYPYVLYSDLYDHQQFIRGVAQTSFSGLLWTPEVRHATNPEDLIRRLQSVVFSPLAMVNAWYLSNPPWKQVDRSANNAGEFAADWEDVEARCREIIALRMRFIPYLHAAFVRYHQEGLPPFRALVLDYPDDPEVFAVDDQYLMGDSVLVAPVVAGQEERSLYLPEGEWYDYWTGEAYAGQQRITLRVVLEHIPLFVKAGTLLPLAQPTLHTEDPASWQLNVRIFGEGDHPTTLFEDDGSAAPALSPVRLEWDRATKTGRLIRSGGETVGRYTVLTWEG